jgi:hypothetical protein
MATARISLFQGLAILLSWYVLAQDAMAEDAPAFDPQALMQVLDQATYVVRGHLISSSDSTATSGERYNYAQFEITEVLKGSISATEISVRRPARSEGSDPARIADNDEDNTIDVIIALGARDPADGSYSPAPGFANGEYRVQADQEGDFVLVNSFGVDADSVSPKDVHRKVANGRVPMELFRRIARGDEPAEPTPVPNAAEWALRDPASIRSPSADPKSFHSVRAPPSVPNAAESDSGCLRMAIAAVFAAIAIAAWFFSRRTSTSRRK